ncbi:MAG: hypothetical protein P8M63_13690 [Paracoccaceae bacterium]|nr:hypothetical protein [Paracoccaceae bacterium]
MKLTMRNYSANQVMQANKRDALLGGLPFCRYSFSSLIPKKERIGGAGLYACFHKEKLIYIGKYRGMEKDWRLGDIVSLRWIKHIGTFTMQARNLGFSKRALSQIQAAVSQTNSLELHVPKGIIDGFETANSNVLQRETGCMTTFQRFKVAVDVWNQAEDLCEPNLNDFKFVYARIEGDFSNSKARELVSAAETHALDRVHPLGNSISGRRDTELPDRRGVEKLFEEVLGASNHIECTGFSENYSSNKINLSKQVSQEPEENSSKFERVMQGAPEFAQEFFDELKSRFEDLNDGEIEFTNTGNTGDMRVRKWTGEVKLHPRNCVRFVWQTRNKRFLMHSQLSDPDLRKFDLSVDKESSDRLGNVTFLTEERLTGSLTVVLEAILHAHKVFKI